MTAGKDWGQRTTWRGTSSNPSQARHALTGSPNPLLTATYRSGRAILTLSEPRHALFVPLVIGNLPPDTDEDRLRSLFAPFLS